jgi:lambda family phage tail tape measure protein
LTRKASDLLEQYRQNVEDLDTQIAGVGADPFKQLMLEREQAIRDASREVDRMTMAVVDLAREVRAAGGELDIGPFRDAIDAFSDRENALAARKYSEGLAEIGENASKAAIELLDFSDAASSQKDALSGARNAIDDYLQSVGTLSENISNVTTNAFSGLEDAIVSLTTTGTFSFRQFALSIVEDLSRMVTRMLIIAPLLKFIQGLLPGGAFASASAGLSGAGALKSFLPGFALNAAGNVYGSNGVVPFARGGIVNGPTMFPFAKGVGLMGEAGPEAIMPLRRGADGRLGVAASGGAGVNVTVNVDAGSSQVQGDGPNANQLGRVIGAAVQAEIVKQQRPGGLLATTR